MGPEAGTGSTALLYQDPVSLSFHVRFPKLHHFVLGQICLFPTLLRSVAGSNKEQYEIDTSLMTLSNKSLLVLSAKTEVFIFSLPFSVRKNPPRNNDPRVTEYFALERTYKDV